MNTSRPYGYLWTGQSACFDADGAEIPCPGSGQDAEFRLGRAWPAPRFKEEPAGCVLDRLSGLTWTLDANPGELPMTWAEALDLAAAMNRERAFGFADWRLPNRPELRSLICHQSRKPPLPQRHPFRGLMQTWYWTSTSAAINPDHAWYVNMAGGRMFFGRKDESFLVWCVRGDGNGAIPASGQEACFDAVGAPIPCSGTGPGTGQDGETKHGRAWPTPRFEDRPPGVLDRLTGLLWRQTADFTGGPVHWPEALAAVADMGRRNDDNNCWRLPNINELESLVDCSAHSPALAAGYPFGALHDVYWSSTTSFFEPDWAWALYLNKGAIGVGRKAGALFHVWAVSEPTLTVM